MLFIVGLGNPDKKYNRNRHNIGFRILDTIASEFSVCWTTKENMMVIEIFCDNCSNLHQNVFLIKPQTFMNNSGKVIPYLKKKGILSEEILIVHDELEKGFGKISLKFGGSTRGHNGLRSIANQLGLNFWRLRFGIGRPERKEDVGDYVLSDFSLQEQKELEVLINQSIKIIKN